MSIFYCAQCDHMSDADDGCDEDPNDPCGLICIDCMAADEDEEDVDVCASCGRYYGWESVRDIAERHPELRPFPQQCRGCLAATSPAKPLPSERDLAARPDQAPEDPNPLPHGGAIDDL
jgi:hypothetical protein